MENKRLRCYDLRLDTIGMIHALLQCRSLPARIPFCMPTRVIRPLEDPSVDATPCSWLKEAAEDSTTPPRTGSWMQPTDALSSCPKSKS